MNIFPSLKNMILINLLKKGDKRKQKKKFLIILIN